MSTIPRKIETLKVFYSLDLVSDAWATASPSDRKPRLVSEALSRTEWPVELIPPEPVEIADLFRVHDTSFVEAVLELRRRNGFGSLSSSVARSLPYTSGACIGSALAALSDGISASLTSGFHHAGPHGARAFCTFNGLMVAAAKLLEMGRVSRLAIVDCDYHYGDGTQAIIDAQELHDRVLHLSFGEHYRKPNQAADYLAEIDRLGTVFEDFRPELVIYQAGADTHVDDPFGGLLTTEQMCVRDRGVFTIAHDLGIPLTWNLAGGYQIEPDGSIPRVVELHMNTFEEALRVWRLL